MHSGETKKLSFDYLSFCQSFFLYSLSPSLAITHKYQELVDLSYSLVTQAFQPAQFFGAAWKGCATDTKTCGSCR